MNDFTGRFSLFPSKEKKSDKSPDYTGTMELTLDQAMALADWLTAQRGEQSYNGDTVVKVRLAGWKAQSKSGLNYLNGKVSPAQPQQQQQMEEVPF